MDIFRNVDFMDGDKYVSVYTDANGDFWISQPCIDLEVEFRFSPEEFEKFLSECKLLLQKPE